MYVRVGGHLWEQPPSSVTRLSATEASEKSLLLRALESSVETKCSRTVLRRQENNWCISELFLSKLSFRMLMLHVVRENLTTQTG